MGSISGISMLFLWFICLLFCPYHNLLIIMFYNKYWSQVTSVCQLCSSGILCWLLGYSPLHINFRISLLISTKLFFWDFDWDFIESRRNDILTICFFYIHWYDNMIFLLSLLILWITLIDFWMWNYPNSRDKSHLDMVFNYFYTFLDSIF